MKRRDFIQAPLGAAGALLLGQVQPAVKAVGAESRDQKVFVKADTDRDDAPFKFLDSIFYVKVSGKDTEGRCVNFCTLRPEKVGPALHLHTDCDEWFFVRVGEFKFSGRRGHAATKTGRFSIRAARREAAPSSRLARGSPA